jgi:hypothetical protein
LAFVDSYNAQVPYLLRAVLPNGLPQLKSLEIQQDIADPQDRKLEGVLWYETLDGDFRIEKNRKKAGSLDFANGYMHSIVRGAPNLEELGLHGIYLDSESMVREVLSTYSLWLSQDIIPQQSLHPALSQLVKMQRFYYNGFGQTRTEQDDDAPPLSVYEDATSDFLSSAEALARVCTRLAVVTNINGKYLPYIYAKIKRDSVGDVTGVRQGKGVGMLISADEEDPFPCNP